LLKRVHGIISGRVQNVFFRAFIEKNAIELNLTGWVRNLSNGCVEFIAEGNEKKLNELIKKTRKGSPLSKVNSVELNWSEHRNEFNGFQRKPIPQTNAKRNLLFKINLIKKMKKPKPVKIKRK
jgi:acylphosphatase